MKGKIKTKRGWGGGIVKRLWGLFHNTEQQTDQPQANPLSSLLFGHADITIVFVLLLCCCRCTVPTANSSVPWGRGLHSPLYSNNGNPFVLL